MNAAPLILLLQPHQKDSQRVIELVHQAVVLEFPNAIVATVGHLQDVYLPTPESVVEAVGKADLVIGNMDGGNQGVTFGLGAALSARKPILLIAPSGRALSVPDELFAYRLFVFSLEEPDLFVDSLRHQVKIALEGGEQAAESEARRIFVSCNHDDSTYLQRLLVHLRPRSLPVSAHWSHPCWAAPTHPLTT